MSDKTALIVTHEDGDHQFEQRAGDGYVNATVMCKAAGKLWGNYYQLKGTQEFLEVLASDTKITVSELIDSFKGRPSHLQGTWVHPRVAIHLASWLSPELEVQVTGWVADWWRRQGEQRAARKEWIPPNLRPWALTFPQEFYTQIYRLKGWRDPKGDPKPALIGHYTNDIVYARLDAEVLETLRIENPQRMTEKHRDKHHQWLTEHKGYHKLREHLEAVITLMRVSDTWKQFRRALNRVLPVYTEQLSLFESREAERTLWERISAPAAGREVRERAVRTLQYTRFGFRVPPGEITNSPEYKRAIKRVQDYIASHPPPSKK